MPGVARLDAPAFRARLDAGPLAVLDVREDFERAHAAIPLPPDAVDLHVPIGEVVARFDEIRAAAQGRPMVVYCHHGQRSMVAATWLSRRGIAAVANLDGGIDSWSLRVDPSVPRY